MKKLVFLAALCITTYCLTAQNIIISFQPKVAGNQIDSILIINQRTNQKVKLPGSESLLLDVTSGIDLIQNTREEGNLYPNPGYGDATLVFSTGRYEDVIVFVCNISGQALVMKRQELSPGLHTFRLKFPHTGLYIVSVRTHDNQQTLKAVVKEGIMQDGRIDYAGSESSKMFKTATPGKTMNYKVGDILHYSVHSGNNNTILTDSPTSDKVYSVEFMKCKDQDNQYYPIVKLGGRWWMAANLNASKYKDGNTIPLVTDAGAWENLSTPGCCWYNNDKVTYGNTYGALYNWFAVNTGKLCPAGWHVPGDEEWTTLENYMIDNGFNYDKTTSGNKIAKSMASLTHWSASTVTGSPGREPGSNNAGGFSGLPGGYREYQGYFSFMGNGAFWWSSTQSSPANAWRRYLGYNINYLNRLGYDKRLGFGVRCLSDILPTVTTSLITKITPTYATGGGNVIAEGETPVTVRGICWNTTGQPTIAGSKTSDGTGAGEFTSKLTGLTTGIKYYVRAYATNSAGTVYGDNATLTADFSNCGTVTDVNGNTYKTVIIGTQCWMAANLKATKYNDGKDIPLVMDNTAWKNLSTPGYCWYSNDQSTYGNTYGALYNWFAAGTGKLCPAGWHVPSSEEWTTLDNFLTDHGYNYDGTTSGNKYAKSMASQTNWYPSGVPGSPGNNPAGNNESGFSGLPGGERNPDGIFMGLTITGSWWSSTDFSSSVYADRRYLNFEYAPVFMGGYDTGYGFSVRCLKN